MRTNISLICIALIALIVAGVIYVIKTHSGMTDATFVALVCMIIGIFFVALNGVVAVPDEVHGCQRRSMKAGDYEVFISRKVNEDKMNVVDVIVEKKKEEGRLSKVGAIYYRLHAGDFYTNIVPFVQKTCHMTVEKQRKLTKIELKEVCKEED